MTRHLTIPDLAERWAVSIPTVERRVARGEIEVLRIGRSVRITEAAIEAYERKHTDPGRTRPTRIS